MNKECITINGWRVFIHPCFQDQMLSLIAKVKTAAIKFPDDWKKKKCARRLAATVKVIDTLITVDPGDERFRQGHTLGKSYSHWRRAKFLQQYRLFFRYSDQHKIIILAWMNDDKTLRARNSHADAYTVFNNMLNKKRPPDNWEQLLKEALKSSSSISALHIL